MESDILKGPQKDPDLKGVFYFSFKDKEKVDMLLFDLSTELNLLRSLRSPIPGFVTSMLRRVFRVNAKDHTSFDIKSPIVSEHIARHECLLGSGQRLFELDYEVGQSGNKGSYTTFAISAEHAKGLVEDKLIREDGLETFPHFTRIRDYGEQPIAWCIDYTERMIDDVKAKRMEHDIRMGNV